MNEPELDDPIALGKDEEDEEYQGPDRMYGDED